VFGHAVAQLTSREKVKRGDVEAILLGQTNQEAIASYNGDFVIHFNDPTWSMIRPGGTTCNDRSTADARG
jgi:hypothetical protein